MSQFWKFSSILAVLALLVVMGLSTSTQTVDAQRVAPTSVCSNDSAGCNIVKFGDHDEDDSNADAYYVGTPASDNTGVTPSVQSHDNVFAFTHSAAGDLVIQNRDLPTVVHKVDAADRTELATGEKCGETADSDTNTVVCIDGPDANPKEVAFTAGTPMVVVAVHQSSGLTDGDNLVQVKAFNGNSIQVSFTPDTGGTFATIRSVRVDNGRPILVSTSPEPGLIVKGNTNITFSADFTDGGAGFASTFESDDTGPQELEDALSPAGILTAAGADADPPTNNQVTKEGGVRLVVAGNVVALAERDFQKIDGGWRVNKTLNSSSIQTIGPNVPWFFEVRDRANNSQRTSGAISRTAGMGTGEGANAGEVVIVDGKFSGSLDGNAFLGSKIRVSRSHGGTTIVSNVQDIDGFAATGSFTIANTAADPLFKDAVATRQDNQTTPTDIAATVGFQCPFDERDTIVLDTDASDGIAAPTVTVKGVSDADPAAQLTACNPKAKDTYEILGTNLITIDSKTPRLQDGGVSTGIVWNAAKRTPGFGLNGRANSIQVKFADDGRNDNDNTGSGLDASTVRPSAFTVSGNSVVSVQTVGNTVYLTLESNLASDAQPTVAIANGVIMDKAGNAFGGARVDKAVDSLGPNLSLSEDSDLSKTRVAVTISTDEQLGALPTVMLGRVINKDGDVANFGDMECVYAKVDAVEGPPAQPMLPKVTRATEEDGSCAAPADATPPLNTRYATPASATNVPGQPALEPSPSQATALSFGYSVTPTVNPTGETGGKYNIYVVGRDTHNEDNEGKVGHQTDANNSAAFTFQLDTVLNDGVHPIVTVSDKTAMKDASDAPDVEAVDPMIVTVDWKGEAGEYSGDSYKTVSLTSAELKITFADGSSETKTFSLTTEVSSPDNIKYTIPLLNPKIGSYTLTVKGEDSAGNVRTDGTGTTPQGLSVTWNVTEAKPVPIELKPGWNLISLPFQPGNPAINSVVPANHPVDIVMTFDNATQVWMVSRRDAETGLFVGDIAVLTASTAYFVRTDNFVALKILRPPLATAAAAPPPPPAITVVQGWNLVPVVSNQIPTPPAIAADDYFGTLSNGANAGWLKALTFNTLLRTWISVSPGETSAVSTDTDDPTDNPCTPADDTAAIGQPCVIATGQNSDVPRLQASVEVGKGYWLYATADGVIIP